MVLGTGYGGEDVDEGADLGSHCDFDGEARSVEFCCQAEVELCETWHRTVVHIIANMAAGIISSHQAVCFT